MAAMFDKGRALQDACFEFLGEIIARRVVFRMENAAFTLLRDRIHNATEVDGFSLDLELDTAICIDSEGPLLKKHELLEAAIQLRKEGPAKNAVYHMILHCEHWLTRLFELGSGEILPDRCADTGWFVRKLKDQRHLGLDIESLSAFGPCREIQETRNAWVHNKGKADRMYIKNADRYARVAAGQLLPLNREYAYEVFASFQNLIEEARSRLVVLHPPNY